MRESPYRRDITEFTRKFNILQMYLVQSEMCVLKGCTELRSLVSKAGYYVLLFVFYLSL